MDKNKKEEKRVESMKAYINTLFDNHSKLNIVRIDLGYKKDENGKVNVSLDDAKKDFKRMLNNRRGKQSIFKNNVGYMVKAEYTKDKGMHFHTAFIFDGQKVKSDYNISKQIGEYWQKITEEKGTYHNCNHDKEKYTKLGIGMVNYSNEEKRKILEEEVLSYLCKDNKKQDLSQIKDGSKVKEFIRGTMPKKKSKAGRPRKNKKGDE